MEGKPLERILKQLQSNSPADIFLCDNGGNVTTPCLLSESCTDLWLSLSEEGTVHMRRRGEEK